MRVGIFLWGIIHGNYCHEGMKYNVEKDLSHCWPNIKNMLVNPLQIAGHDVRLYVSTYTSENRSAHTNILKSIGPKAIIYSNKTDSKSYTTKLKSFDLMKNVNDIDAVILCRSDMHFSKSPVDRIDLNKFNFFFPAAGKRWWDILKFTDDNFYVWPTRMTPQVEESMYACRRFRPELNDTHALYPQLVLRVDESEINFISDIPEGSDINSFYTVCRKELAGSESAHPEVRDRFKYEI